MFLLDFDKLSVTSRRKKLLVIHPLVTVVKRSLANSEIGLNTVLARVKNDLCRAVAVI